VRIKCALHVHSTFSSDGTLSIAELAGWYRARGYAFLAMAEHAEDLDDGKLGRLVEDCARSSDERFCILPGVEFSLNHDTHILGVGFARRLSERDPSRIAARIHDAGGFSVLAHPRRGGWAFPNRVLRAVDAVEIWNIGYDGKYLPPIESLRKFKRIRRIKPGLLAVASHDLHRTPSFYDVGISMDVEALSARTVLDNLRAGRFTVSSRFFQVDSAGRLSLLQRFSLGVFGPVLHNSRRIRNAFARGRA
jgi:hypothetical protein